VVEERGCLSGVVLAFFFLKFGLKTLRSLSKMINVPFFTWKDLLPFRQITDDEESNKKEGPDYQHQ